MPTLHVVIPHYEEPATVEACLGRVAAAPLPEGWAMWLHLVDDGSSAGSVTAAERTIGRLVEGGIDAELVRHPVNRGKGAAVRTGFARAVETADEGDLVVIQDADLEYDPSDYAALMRPLVAGEADAVLGTRWGPHRRVSGLVARVHRFGNRVLTELSNLATGERVTDMECCYKLFTVPALRAILPRLTEERFGIEPQIVAGLAREGSRIVEVPVSYDPRGFESGKKIGVKDLLRALWVIGRERVAPAAGRSPAPWRGADDPRGRAPGAARPSRSAQSAKATPP